MPRIEWDKDGERLFETGLSKGVLYPKNAEAKYTDGVAWNGLTAVTEKPSGAEPTKMWADNMKYLEIRSAEEYDFTIEAYIYPDEFAACDGHVQFAPGVKAGQQPRKPFGLCYRTEVGNDIEFEEYSYKLHLVYGATVNPSERSNKTINDSPEAVQFSWDASTTPIVVEGLIKPISELEVEAKDFTPDTKKLLSGLEGILYGANAFDETSKYDVGDVVEYGTSPNTKVYVCKTAITTGSDWDATKWIEIGETGPRLPLPDEVKRICTISLT